MYDLYKLINLEKKKKKEIVESKFFISVNYSFNIMKITAVSK